MPIEFFQVICTIVVLYLEIDFFFVEDRVPIELFLSPMHIVIIQHSFSFRNATGSKTKAVLDTEEEIFYESGYIKPNLDCNYIFLIVLPPNRNTIQIWFGLKTFRRKESCVCGFLDILTKPNAYITKLSAILT